MTYERRWLMLAIATLAACGGGGENQSGRATATPASTSGGGAGATTSAGPAAGAAQAITGKTWDVRMLGGANGYRFEPAAITVKEGDGVRWTNVSGGPHNVTFWPDSIPQGAQQVLQGNMPQPMSPLAGPLLTQPSQTYTISFGGAPKGLYHYYCMPHVAVGMKGTITIQ